MKTQALFVNSHALADLSTNSQALANTTLNSQSFVELPPPPLALAASHAAKVFWPLQCPLVPPEITLQVLALAAAHVLESAFAAAQLLLVPPDFTAQT